MKFFSFLFLHVFVNRLICEQNIDLILFLHAKDAVEIEFSKIGKIKEIMKKRKIDFIFVQVV